MKNRTDFVANSSTSAFLIPFSKTHDKSLWYKNTLRIYPDTGKIQMEFDDFENGYHLYNTLHDNWRFVCTQLIHWVIPDVIDGSTKTTVKLIRKLTMSEEFEKLNDAVKNYFSETEGISMFGVEFDPEDIKDDKENDIRILRPECQLNHESIFAGWDEMLEKSGCSSIAELIWGVKQINLE